MNKIFTLLTAFLLTLTLNAQQKIVYNDTFDYYTSYCPGDPQYDNWGTFRGSLDTTVDRFMSITMKGTYDMVGKTCADKYAVRQIADALYYGYDATISCNGLDWKVGTGCSNYNCGNSSEYIELTVNQYTCNCGNSYTIRPCYTTANWGGINTETCQEYYQNANQRMIAEVLRIYGNDNIGISKMNTIQDCINTQSLSFNVLNFGTNSVSNYYIGYSINGTNQTPIYVTTALNSEEEVNLLTANYTFSPNAAYDIKVWTYSPNGVADGDVSNDTAYVNYTHTGSPAVPTASNFVNCGNGRVDISASGASADTLLWYSVPTAGSILGKGTNFYTPFLTRTDTFYVEANRFKSTEVQFGTTFHNWSMISYDPNQYNGGMFNIDPNKLIKINGFKVQSLFGNTTPRYRVYVREGGYNGYETNASAWKIIFDADLTNGQTINTIPVEYTLEPGIKYGFYITTDPLSGEDIWVNYGNSSYSNSDITLSSDNFIYGLFGSNGVYTPYSLDVECLYSITCASSSRKPVIVTINPKPSGSILAQGVTYEGQYRLGEITKPDITEVGNTVQYELTPPTGYTNSDYNSTWAINSVTLNHIGGSAVDPTSFSFTNPSGSQNGVLNIVPDASSLDSTIVVKIQYQDLGPYFCDTTVTRLIIVAPTPKPNFKFPKSVCTGDDVLFENLSTIHSGNMTYKWYFSANDSSDIFEPVSSFPTFGSYNVKLVVTSFPYGIVEDTTIVVNVSDIPNVKFKVLNACEGAAVRFLNQTTVNSGSLSYTWDFGDNSATSSATNPTHIYTVPNGYRVTLSANSGGCIGELTKNAYEFSRPVAKFDAPTTPVCNNLPAVLTNQSTLLQGLMGSLWTLGDGNLSTENNVSHLYMNTGSYNVKLKMVSEFGCEDSIVKTVVIKPSPMLNFTTDKLCNLTTTNFINNSPEYAGVNSAYTWTFDDATTQNTKNAVKNWTNIGEQTVKLKSVLTNGCQAEITKTFNVLLQAKADFTVSDICSNETALFTNKTKVSQGSPVYSWNFGDASPLVSDFNPKHQYTNLATNTFTVELVAKVVGGCNDTIRKLLTVTQIPNCNFNIKPYFLPNNLGFKFEPAITSNSTYFWTFGEGGNSTDISPIYQYLYTGSFNVKLISTNSGGCKCEQIIKLNAIQSSIKDINTANIQVSPNPANTSFKIQLNNQNITIAKMYNALGQLISTNTFTDNTEIDTKELSSGIYTLIILNNNVNVSTKIVVNH